MSSTTDAETSDTRAVAGRAGLRRMLPVGAAGPVTGRTWLLRAMALALLVGLPFVLNNFRTGQLTEILIFAVLAASLDLLVGFTGLPSLGHAAFFGVGGYTAALVAREVAPQALLMLVAAVVVATVVAVVTGWLAVRTRGVYFLMLTLAFAQLTFSLALTWAPVTGGANGLSVPGTRLFGLSLSSNTVMYFYMLGLFVLAYLGLRRVVTSPFGRALVGVRENEARMRSVGYATGGYKLASFVIAGAFGGLAGGMYAQFSRFMAPTNIAFEVSALVLIMIIMGGIGTLWGPVIGAAFVLLLRDELSARVEHWELVLGVVFVAFVYLLPRGLAGLVRRIDRNRSRGVATAEPATASTAKVDM